MLLFLSQKYDKIDVHREAIKNLWYIKPLALSSSWVNAYEYHRVSRFMGLCILAQTLNGSNAFC